MTEGTANVRGLVDNVSAGSEEQSRGITQSGQAILQMGQVTQGSAASAEECAAAAEELSAQSERLREVIGGIAAMVGTECHKARVGRLMPAWSPRTSLG